MNIRRKLFLILHYALACKLVFRSIPIGEYAHKFRAELAKNIFRWYGNSIHIKQGAYIRKGDQGANGDYYQIDENTRIPSNTCIGSNVMIELQVLVLSIFRKLDQADIPLIVEGYEDYCLSS
jgi:hypothetical protein